MTHTGVDKRIKTLQILLHHMLKLYLIMEALVSNLNSGTARAAPSRVAGEI
jgi:hypothetical protein